MISKIEDIEPGLQGKTVRQQLKLRNALCVIMVWSLVICLAGCDAFVRKFTRKAKKDESNREEVVIAPQEYKPTMSKEEIYRQCLVFWQSWQDELSEALLRNASHKKQVSCAQQAINNLEQLGAMLNGGKKKDLVAYLDQMKMLRDDIISDSYGSGASMYRTTAEHLKREILRNFSYNDVKNSLS